MNKLQNIITQNKDLFIKAGVTVTSGLLANVERLTTVFQMIASLTAIVVGILTIIKLFKELSKK